MRGVHCLTPEKRPSVEDKKCKAWQALMKTNLGAFLSSLVMFVSVGIVSVCERGASNSNEKKLYTSDFFPFWLFGVEREILFFHRHHSLTQKSLDARVLFIE